MPPLLLGQLADAWRFVLRAGTQRAVLSLSSSYALLRHSLVLHHILVIYPTFVLHADFFLHSIYLRPSSSSPLTLSSSLALSSSLTLRPSLAAYSLIQSMLDQAILTRVYLNDDTFSHLDLSYCSLKISDLPPLITALRHNTSLTEVDLSGNPIGNDGVQLLCASGLRFSSLRVSDCGISVIGGLLMNDTITRVDAASNLIGSEGCAQLTDSHLEWLSLAGNRVGDQGAECLALSQTLTYLNVSNNQIGVAGAEALSRSTTITHLIISNNVIQADGAVSLATNVYLTTLVCAGNHINTGGIIALSQNTRLTSLDLGYNEVNDDGLFGFAGTRSLTHLNLGYNQITSHGVRCLLASSITSLVICHNLLGDEGAKVLAKQPTITQLDVAGNRIGFSGSYALSRNIVLTALTLSINMLGDVGGIVLAQNKTLTELHVSYNGIGDAAALAFADNTTLRLLNLNYNSVKELGRQTLKKNLTITTLMLSDEQPPEFSDENLDTIFLLSESFLCISDLKNTLQFFNPSFSRVLGYSSDELLTRSMSDFLHPADRKESRLHARDKTPFTSYENRYRCKDGSIRHIRWTTHTKHDRQYAVGNDITEQRRVEYEMKTADNNANSRLLNETRAYTNKQTDFISQLSHEIRNPLSGMMGLTEVCTDQMGSFHAFLKELLNPDSLSPKTMSQNRIVMESFVAEIGESLIEITRCGEYQCTILNDNLDIVKILEGKLELGHSIMELRQVLRDVVSMLHAKATSKGLTLRFSVLDDVEVWVTGDMMRIKQVFMNLVGNAVKFTENGSVDIILRQPVLTGAAILIMIDVVDTGVGLSVEEQLHLFERFSQTRESIGGTYGGSGLGLYLAKQMARAMQGDIMVTSSKGKGSCFSVRLLLGAMTPEECKSIEEKKQTIVPPVADFIRRNILVVEDNVINQKLLVRMLEGAGHQCRIAEDGVKALWAHAHEKFDVILMDVMMPLMDGVTATRIIRLREAENSLARTPIFALTANALESNQVEGIEAGVDQYLTKPVKKQNLLDRIVALPSMTGPQFSALILAKAVSAPPSSVM
jgi:PAS domain S-box-containing protein